MSNSCSDPSQQRARLDINAGGKGARDGKTCAKIPRGSQPLFWLPVLRRVVSGAQRPTMRTRTRPAASPDEAAATATAAAAAAAAAAATAAAAAAATATATAAAAAATAATAAATAAAGAAHDQPVPKLLRRPFTKDQESIEKLQSVIDATKGLTHFWRHQATRCVRFNTTDHQVVTLFGTACELVFCESFLFAGIRFPSQKGLLCALC